MSSDQPQSTIPESTRAGFVGVIGAPNAGKSTLVNALVGEKVSIVTPKVQTTRMPIRGIVTTDQAQIVFIDTPGIFKPKKPLEKAMVQSAWDGGMEADVLLLLVDASLQGGKALDRLVQGIIDGLQRQGAKNKPVILVLNKIDKIKRENLLDLTVQYNEMYDFAATYMISALKEDGLKQLLPDLMKMMPESPFLFPADDISDLPQRLLAAEITREKLFLNMHQELPYELTVESEVWEMQDNGNLKIGQVIYVARDTHKKIILGKGGSAIKRVGQDSRTELEDLFQTPVYLDLYVKVRENWVRDPERYRFLGLDYTE